jgi:L-alanine-DL-glutamate epimerase-like enolase superfamily enzyme
MHKDNYSRREFLKTAGLSAGLAVSGMSSVNTILNTGCSMKPKEITIDSVDSNFEREPLIRPFGFKGGYMSEIWQTIAYLRSNSGIHKIGLCTQNVLWSDARVFASFSESGGNALMYTLSDYALKIVNGQSFQTPIDLLDNILDEVYEYGKKVTANPHLRKTFALNALVGIDNAAWLLYAQENGIKNFDDMIPEKYKPSLSYQHKHVASIPLMAYSIPIEEIVEAADQGYFFMKIKIGQPGTQEEMLQKDKDRLSAIHASIGNRETKYTNNGKLPYYFDANGRYESKDTLMRLLDHAQKIGAFDQIAVVEEPFPEEKEIDVHDIPLRLAADESAHTDEDAQKRIDMGYKAIALKAIAKTLSMTMKIAKVAHEQNIPCFCADLTVNPILVDWNKNVASRLAPFPELGLGLLETNGHQNYKNWKTMFSYHPDNGANWTRTVNGVFNLDENYYQQSGGIFKPSDHYETLFAHHKD